MADRSPVQNIINGLHERNLLDDARAVATEHHVTVTELLSDNGRQSKKAKHALIKRLTDRGLDNSFVAKVLRMDPTTVLQARRKVSGQSTA